MNPQLWWYVARASGLTAWLMLTASVVWGVVLSTKAFPTRRRPAWLLDLHRWLGGLTVAFVGLHIGALVADNYTHFGVAEVTVPYASEWRPGAVALGVVATWLLAAVMLTSAAMRKLPKRFWRGVHVTSYAAFWLTSLHGAFAGSDATTGIYRWSSALAIAAVAWAAMYRLTNRRGQRTAAARPVPAAPART